MGVISKMSNQPSYTGDDQLHLTRKELPSAAEWRHIEENSYTV